MALPHDLDRDYRLGAAGTSFTSMRDQCEKWCTRFYVKAAVVFLFVSPLQRGTWCRLTMMLRSRHFPSKDIQNQIFIARCMIYIRTRPGLSHVFTLILAHPDIYLRFKPSPFISSPPLWFFHLVHIGNLNMSENSGSYARVFDSLTWELDVCGSRSKSCFYSVSIGSCVASMELIKDEAFASNRLIPDLRLHAYGALIFGLPHAVKSFESFGSNMAHSEESRLWRRVDKLRANAERLEYLSDWQYWSGVPLLRGTVQAEVPHFIIDIRQLPSSRCTQMDRSSRGGQRLLGGMSFEIQSPILKELEVATRDAEISKPRGIDDL
ncbi:hypothetical protein P692DRAFT_20819600 [Suillus brevipes Sb2]|nr:hypothetical protein P692DRAFT_20819600 [Suillus brevipes Sb2]